MKRIICGFGLGLLMTFAVPSVASAQAAATRNYDCSKAGNANKTVCKAAAAKAAAKPSIAATAPKARNYDCSKAGNANKAVCKSAAAAAAPSAPATRNYDCSKAGNANKAVCKNARSTTASQPQQQPAPATYRRPTSTAAATTSGQNTNAGGPNGATAKCRDNTYSFSAHRSGTCSRHGGVSQWY